MERRHGLVLAVAVLVAVVAAAVVLGPFGLAGSSAEPAGPGFVHDGDRLTVEPAAGQTIEGRTDLANGTTVSVRLRSSGENPFLVTRSATVDRSGTFSATFDLSGVPAGTTFRATVHHDGERLMNATATVVS